MHKASKRDSLKIILIGLIFIIIAMSHHFLKGHEHMFFLFLFYFPIILSAFWFGLRGSIISCLVMLLFYIPHLISYINWNNFSQKDLDEIIEVLMSITIAVLLGILVDREREYNNQLLEQQRLAAIGRTVSEIAHDMKTPLMSIGGFVTQVARRMPEDDPAKKKLDIVIEEVSRLEKMVKNMLEFSKSVNINKSEVNINRLIRDINESIQDIANRSKVRIVLNLSPELSNIIVDEEKLKRALLNVITNAIQASPPHESVVISTEKKKGNVVIRIKDHGPGIRDDQKGLIFKTFFTTKEEGTGLGLAISKKIIEAHGGKISFYSNKGESGTTFVIELPIK